MFLFKILLLSRRYLVCRHANLFRWYKPRVADLADFNTGLFKDKKLKFVQSLVPVNILNVQFSHLNNVTIENSCWKKLASSIKQHERVSLSEVNACLSQIEQQQADVVQENCLLLLGCCGNLLPNVLPKKRTELVTKIWNVIQEKVITLDVRYYEKFLQCLVENNESIECKIFIKDMLKKGIDPNQKIFQLLLESASDRGLIGDISYIIQQMKNRGFSADEVLFSLLITAHYKKDSQLAHSVLDTMNTAGITPGSITYTALIKGATEIGNYEQITNYFHIAETKNIKFTVEQLLSVIKTLVLSGNDIFVPTVMKYISCEQQDLCKIANLMSELVCLGYVDSAVQLLSFLNVTHSEQQLAFSLIKDLLMADVEVSKVIDCCKTLMERINSNSVILKAVEVCLQTGKMDAAMKFYQQFETLGVPLRTHYFWPLLVQASQLSGSEGVYGVLKDMIKLNIKPDEETLLNYVFPNVVSLDVQLTLYRLLEVTQLTVTHLINPLLYYLLKCENIVTAHNLAKQHRDKCDVVGLCSATIRLYITKQDHFVLDLLTLWPEFDSGYWLLQLLNHPKCNLNKKEFLQLLDEVKKRKLKVSPERKISIGDVVAGLYQDVSDVKRSLWALSDSPFTRFRNTVALPHPNNMSVEELEDHLIELESKQMNTRGVLRKLLLMYCGRGDVEKSNQIINKLKASRCQFSPGMTAALLDLYLKNNLCQQAVDVYNELNKFHQHFIVDRYKILMLADLLLADDRLTECIQILEANSSSPVSKDFKSSSKLCRILLTTSTQLGIATTKNLLNILVKHKYCEINNQLLGPLIKSYIIRNDLEGAVREYVQCTKVYNKTPLQQELMIQIIKHGDEEMLERVEKVSDKCHGRVSTQLKLLIAYATVGDINLLTKFIMEEKFNFKTVQLKQKYERLVHAKHAEPLLNLLHTVQCNGVLEMNIILDHIIQIYYITGDTGAAIKLWTKLQSLNLTPSQQFISSISTLLTSHNIPFPPVSL